MIFNAFFVVAEADRQARAKGDSEDEAPSKLVDSVSSIFSELIDLLGIDGFFRDSKEDDDSKSPESDANKKEEDEDDDEEYEDDDEEKENDGEKEDDDDKEDEEESTEMTGKFTV